jgi:hypothetical protein
LGWRASRSCVQLNTKVSFFFNSFLAFFDIGVADVVAYAGRTGLGVLATNRCLGILISQRYDIVNRLPKQRLPLTTIHEWAGYSALVLVFLHPSLLLLSSKPVFSVLDLFWPLNQPVQPLETSLGALAAYICIVVVVTSYFRGHFSFRAWKTIHYTTYVLAPALIWHAVFSEPTLTDQAIVYLDGGKVFAEFASLLIVVAASARGWLAWRRMRTPLPAGVTILRDDGEIAPVWRGELCIAAMCDETPDVRTIALKSARSENATIRLAAGAVLDIALKRTGRPEPDPQLHHSDFAHA